MEKTAKEAEAAHIPGGVWVWLSDRLCLVDQHVAAIYRRNNPLPESLQPSPRQGIKRGRDSPELFAFRGDGTQADGVSRNLSESDIRKRSSSSHTPSSATHRGATRRHGFKNWFNWPNWFNWFKHRIDWVARRALDQLGRALDQRGQTLNRKKEKKCI